MDARRASIFLYAAIWAMALSATLTGFPPDWSPIGTEKTVPMPSFNAETLLSGRFGEEFERHFAQTFGLRGFGIRLEHQLEWELFGTLPSTSGTVIHIGQDNWLYEHDYVRHHIRRFEMRQNEAKEFAARMSLLRERLAKHGIPLVVCLSPSKAAVYPEHLPKDAEPSAEDLRNTPARDLLVEWLRKADVAVVDGRALFLEWKRNGPLLFARKGTHWNAYGAQRVFDAIIAAARAQNATLPPVPEVVGHVDAPPLAKDSDLSVLYNMVRYPYPEVSVPYPILADVPTSTDRRLRILGVGDSFSFQLADAMGRSGAVESFRLLYYYKADYRFAWMPDERPRENVAERFRLPSFDVEKFDLDEATRDCDLVVVEMNDIFARRRAWGFAL